jgi:hypothetical protein
VPQPRSVRCQDHRLRVIAGEGQRCNRWFLFHPTGRTTRQWWPD